MCAMMGYPKGATRITNGASSDGTAVSSLNCAGNEPSLLDCPGSWGYLAVSSAPKTPFVECANSCSSLQYFSQSINQCVPALVQSCGAGKYFTPSAMFADGYCTSCPNGKFIDDSSHRRTSCTTCSACPLGTFLKSTCPKTRRTHTCVACEELPQCGSESSTRMVGGNGVTSGYAEIFSREKNRWVKVSNSYFGANEVKVVCPLLGYPSGTYTTQQVSLPEDTPVATGLGCNGKEGTLTNCSYSMTESPEKFYSSFVRCHKTCNWASEYFSESLNECMPLTHHHCGPGKHWIQATGKFTNNDCSACKQGSFLNAINHTITSCAACTPCPNGKVLVTHCNRTHDHNVCAACQDVPACGKLYPTRLEPYSLHAWTFAQVFYGTWMRVSRTSFGAGEANVACRAGGYYSGELNILDGDQANAVSHLGCSGSENSLLDCSKRIGVQADGGKNARVKCWHNCTWATEYMSIVYDGCTCVSHLSCGSGKKYTAQARFDDSTCTTCERGKYISDSQHTKASCHSCTPCPKGSVIYSFCPSTRDGHTCRACSAVSQCGSPQATKLSKSTRGVLLIYESFMQKWLQVKSGFVNSGARKQVLLNTIGYDNCLTSSIEVKYGDHINHLSCIGNETSLDRCSFSVETSSYRDYHRQELRCYNVCAANEYFQESSKACRPMTLSCPAGKYFTPRGTSTSDQIFTDNKCVTCPTGSFISATQHTIQACTGCTLCPSDMDFWKYCDPDRDNNYCRSRSPTTFSPTSLSPTTCGPTTCGPTTLGPTSLSPTTDSPATYAPTRNPTTSGPATRSPTRCPTTCGPTSLSPTSLSPTTFGPTTRNPTRNPTLGPTTCGPTTCGPTTWGPTTLCPTTCSPTMTPTTRSPFTRSPTMETPTAIDTRFSDTVRLLRIIFIITN